MFDEEQIAEEYEKLKKQYNSLLADLQTVASNPKTRKHIRAIFKEAGLPDTLPVDRQELVSDLEEEVSSKVTPIKEQLDMIGKKLDQKEASEKQNELISVMRRYGLVESDYQKVIQFMSREGIMKFDTACKLYAQQKFYDPSSSIPTNFMNKASEGVDVDQILKDKDYIKRVAMKTFADLKF